MDHKDAHEAAPIVQRSLKALVSAVPANGRDGASLRTACGALSVSAEVLLASDALGPPLLDCFDLARTAGASPQQIAVVRNTALAETPKLLGAVLVKNAIVYLCLANEGLLIAGETFTSRQDIDALQQQVNQVYAGVEEVAADDMDQMTYQRVIALHAALTYFLTQSARPLPRMLRFAFAASMPTLITAMRLYSDGGRADELRDENKVVHPAFMLPTGRALSA